MNAAVDRHWTVNEIAYFLGLIGMLIILTEVGKILVDWGVALGMKPVDPIFGTDPKVGLTTSQICFSVVGALVVVIMLIDRKLAK